MQQLRPGVQLQAEFSVTHLGNHAEPGGNGEAVVEKVGHRFSGSDMAGDATGRFPGATICRRPGICLRPCLPAGRTVSIADKVAVMEPIDADAFEALVASAIEEIPDELRAEMENVAIIVDDESPPGRLYGLYEGIPLTKRGTYAGARPDQITLFLATICRSASTTEDLARRVRITLLHEVGHHFGIGEARLRELGWS